MGRFRWELSPRKWLFLGGLLLTLCVLSVWLFRRYLPAGSLLLDFALFIGGVGFGYYCAVGQFCFLSAMRPSSVDVIDIMQMQRHDFLNHLQVLGGLAQLKKTDRVMEYIATAVQELNCERSITKLLPAETGLVLLSWVQRLRSLGIRYNIDLCTDMSQAHCGAYLAELTTELLNSLLKEKAKLNEIIFHSGCRNNVIELELIVRGYVIVPLMSLTRSRELVRKMGGTLSVDQLEDMVRFRVLLPLVASGSA